MRVTRRTAAVGVVCVAIAALAFFWALAGPGRGPVAGDIANRPPSAVTGSPHQDSGVDRNAGARAPDATSDAGAQDGSEASTAMSTTSTAADATATSTRWTLRVVVVEADGGSPIAGAAVELWVPADEGAARGGLGRRWFKAPTRFREARAGDEGGCVFAGLRQGRFAVRVFARNHEPRLAYLEQRGDWGDLAGEQGVSLRSPGVVVTPGTEHRVPNMTVNRLILRVELPLGREIRGRVTDPERRPIAGIEVSAFCRDGPAARAGPDGRFVLDGLPIVRKQATLWFRDPRQRYFTAFRKLPPGDDGIEVTLRRGGTLTVRVIDDETGAPIQGVSPIVDGVGVRFEPDRFARYSSVLAGWTPRTLRTGPDGELTVAPVRDGRYAVRLDHPSYAFWDRPVDVEGGLGSVEARLARGSPVRGRVTLQGGRRAASGAVVAELSGLRRGTAASVEQELREWFGRQELAERRRKGTRMRAAWRRTGVLFTRADAEGRYELSRVAAGSRRFLFVKAGQPAVRRIAEVHAGSPLRLDVDLGVGASLRGRVQDRDGHGVEGAVVSVGERVAKTGIGGGFRLAGLPPGRATVELIRMGHVDEDVPGPRRREVDLRRGATVEVVFGIVSGAAIAGRVRGVDVDGGPWRHRVFLVGSQGVEQRRFLGSDGAFRFGGLAPGRYRVALSPPGAVREVEIPAGATEVPFEFVVGKRTLGGVVVDAAGRPVPRATVVMLPGVLADRILSVDRRWPVTACKEYVRDAGRFLFEHLDPGPLELVVGAEGFSEARVRVAGDAEGPLRITLQTDGGGLAVRASGADGQALPFSVRVVAVDSAGRPFQTVYRKDAQARRVHGRISGLPPGSYTVWAFASDNPELAFARLGPVAVEGSEVPVDVAFRPASTLAIQCVDRTGSPVAGARVTRIRFGACDLPSALVQHVTQLARSSADGTLRSRGLAPGSYEVTVAADERRVSTVRVDIAPAAEARARVSFW